MAWLHFYLVKLGVEEGSHHAAAVSGWPHYEAGRLAWGSGKGIPRRLHYDSAEVGL